MTIEDAVKAIVGESLGSSLIDKVGINWAVISAMAEARASDNPEALATIRNWNIARQQKRDRQ